MIAQSVVQLQFGLTATFISSFGLRNKDKNSIQSISKIRNNISNIWRVCVGVVCTAERIFPADAFDLLSFKMINVLRFRETVIDHLTAWFL